MRYLTTYKLFELLSVRDEFSKNFVFPDEHIQNIINDVFADLMDDGVGVEVSPWDSRDEGFTLTVGADAVSQHLFGKDAHLIYWKDVKGYADHLIKSLSEEGVRLTGIHIGTFTYDSFNQIEDCFDRLSTPEGKELERPHDCFYFYFVKDKDI